MKIRHVFFHVNRDIVLPPTRDLRSHRRPSTRGPDDSQTLLRGVATSMGTHRYPLVKSSQRSNTMMPISPESIRYILFQKSRGELHDDRAQWTYIHPFHCGSGGDTVAAVSSLQRPRRTHGPDTRRFRHQKLRETPETALTGDPWKD